jgi:hypothetical protein
VTSAADGSVEVHAVKETGPPGGMAVMGRRARARGHPGAGSRERRRVATGAAEVLGRAANRPS